MADVLLFGNVLGGRPRPRTLWGAGGRVVGFMSGIFPASYKCLLGMRQAHAKHMPMAEMARNART